MIVTDRNLIIKKSTIPGAGKGLFTKISIAKGTHIIEYKGKISTWKDVDHQEGSNSYIYYVSKNYVIDGQPFIKEKARYANDARGLTRIKGITNNCRYTQVKRKVFIEARKSITAGSEILVDYGKEYWDTVKLNAKC